jgi:hypothetical protein
MRKSWCARLAEWREWNTKVLGVSGFSNYLAFSDIWSTFRVIWSACFLLISSAWSLRANYSPGSLPFETKGFENHTDWYSWISVSMDSISRDFPSIDQNSLKSIVSTLCTDIIFLCQYLFNNIIYRWFKYIERLYRLHVCCHFCTKIWTIWILV